MHLNKTNGVKSVFKNKRQRGVWWRLLRPHTLTASFIPVFVGTMLAMGRVHLDIGLFLAMLLASMLIQSATNFFNEYYDFKRGLDNVDSIGIGGAIVRDGIHPKVVLRLACLFFGIAIMLGFYICAASSWWLALVGLCAMLVGYLYTGGPYPIAYSPFGEFFAGLLMGTLIIGISFFIQTNTLAINVIWVSIPIALFISCLLLANNIRDRVGDKENGRKTIAILLGRKYAILLQTILFILIYALTAFYIVIGILPYWSAITFLSIVTAVKSIKAYRGKSTPLEMLPAMIATGKTNTIYGFLLGLSLLLKAII